MKKVKTDRYGSGDRYRVKYADADGNARSRSFPDGQYQAAKDWKSEVEVALKNGTYVDPSDGKTSVKAFAKAWMADLDIDVLSLQNMEMRFRSKIFPQLGGTALAAVKPSTIRSWDRKLREDGLSDRYRHTLFGNLSAMFTAALEDGLIARHPFAGKSVKKPQPVKGKVVPWSEERIWAVQGNLRERFAITVDLGAGIGLRQGEMFGLAEEDIDLEKGIVHVRRQVKNVQYKHVFALPKNGKKRDVPLPAPVRDALKHHMLRFPPREIVLPWEKPDGAPHAACLIVTSSWGRVVDAKDFNRDYWKPALKLADVPHGKYENGMHDLRHFFASTLLDRGESIKAVAEWLGHSDASFTLRTYTHLMPSSDERTKSVINSLYDRKDAKKRPKGPQRAQKDEQAP